MKKTYVLLANANYYSLEDFEVLNNQCFTNLKQAFSVLEINSELARNTELECYEISDFIQEWNEDRINMTNNWLIYFHIDEKTDSLRTQLMNTEIYQHLFTLQDFYNSSGQHEREIIDKMGDGELKNFLKGFKHQLSKAIQAGINFSEAADTALSECLEEHTYQKMKDWG